MSEKIVQIWRDPFARATLVRRVSDDLVRRGCGWCGSLRPRGGRLFQYGWQTDDSERIHWDGNLFCSRDCRRVYYG